MNTNKELPPFAYTLRPGVDTFQGGKVTRISGPHMMPKGRCVRIEYMGVTRAGFPGLQTEYVLALARVPQV